MSRSYNLPTTSLDVLLGVMVGWGHSITWQVQTCYDDEAWWTDRSSKDVFFEVHDDIKHGNYVMIAKWRPSWIRQHKKNLQESTEIMLNVMQSDKVT